MVYLVGSFLVVIQISQWLFVYLNVTICSQVYFGNLCFSKEIIRLHIYLHKLAHIYPSMLLKLLRFMHRYLFHSFSYKEQSGTALDFTTSVLKAWGQCSNTFKSLRENYFHPITLYPVRLDYSHFQPCKDTEGLKKSAFHSPSDLQQNEIIKQKRRHGVQ